MAKQTTTNSAPHFSPGALTFLRGLARHNDRDWFAERKAVYERELKAPMLAVVEAVNEALARFAPEHVRPPHKAMMRIYRDIRFSPNKNPYKTHVAAWWARAGLEKTTGAGFYLQIAAGEVLIAGGCYMPSRDQLLAIRRHLLEHHGRMRRLAGEKKLLRLSEPIDGQKLTRAPKGFPPEHPALDLLVCRQWGVSATLPSAVALEPALVRAVVERFQAMGPLVRFLNEPLVPRSVFPGL